MIGGPVIHAMRRLINAVPRENSVRLQNQRQGCVTLFMDPNSKGLGEGDAEAILERTQLLRTTAFE